MKKDVFDLLKMIKAASQIKVSRYFEGFFCDRIIQASSEKTLVGFFERLSKSLDVETHFINRDLVGRTLSLIGENANEAEQILNWIRKNPRISGMILMIKDETDYLESLEIINYEEVKIDNSSLIAQPKYDIPIEAICLHPLAHGSDMKAGNSTLFRRRQVLTSTGKMMELPFYSGNAIRGGMRDLLADHFLTCLGLKVDRLKPILNLWFFHALYAGGVLSEGDKTTKLIESALGNNGALKTDGYREIREKLPNISLLGAAIGNRILPGRICVGDLRPKCKEWGYGDQPVEQLLEFIYLTRREDYEGRTDEDGNKSMIATTEVLKEGSVLVGGIDLDTHINEVEKSCLVKGLELLQSKGKLGAESRRGLGKVQLTFDSSGTDSSFYESYLKDNTKVILDYLGEMNALCQPDS